tara:strand:- start:64 stop:1533 length:1470 start_codon:yes stop_codon:yes gene_type:complete
MNFKLYILYGLVCFFPNWVFRANLGINDILILFFFFFIIPIFIHNKIFKFYLKNSSEIIYYWLSLITFYTLDQNFSLWGVAKHGILNINLNSPYLNSILSATISIIFIYFLFYFSKKNALKIIFSFILVVFIFNIFDSPKNYSNFPKVDLIENKQVIKKKFNKRLVMIFDEMSGLNHVDSNVYNGEISNQSIKNYFAKNNFDIYINAFALFRDTDQSLGSALNFIKTNEEYINIDKNKEVHFINKSNNYFVTNELKQNKFFDINDHKNIIVNQSMYINYCNHPKVIVCNQFNPFDENLSFIRGFKNTKLSRYVSAYRNNGAIISYFFWRLALQIRLIDSFLDPDGEKAAIKYIFNQVFDNIKNYKETSLFFSHIVVPHIPFGFNDKCEYDGDKTTNFNRITLKQKRIQHNVEKLCLINYLDELFFKLKKINEFKNLEIIIFSDHDSRFVLSDSIENNVIYFHKDENSKTSIIKNNKISINDLLYSYSVD